MMASHAGVKPGMEAEAARLGAVHGLGPCTGSWDLTRFIGRVVLARILLVLLALVELTRLRTMPGHHPAAADAGLLALAAAAVLAMAAPPRKRRIQVYLYAGGMARVSNVRPRLIVMAWADLEAVSIRVIEGYDEAYVDGCLLRDRAGETVSLSAFERDGAREAIMDAVQQVIAGRLLGPLIAQVDAGETVTFGDLIVGPAGISCTALGTDGRWHVPWLRMQSIRITMRGQRVRVETGRRDCKTAKLDGEPNSFLAQYAIEQAARRAGVPVSAE